MPSANDQSNARILAVTSTKNPRNRVHLRYEPYRKRLRLLSVEHFFKLGKFHDRNGRPWS